MPSVPPRRRNPLTEKDLLDIEKGKLLKLESASGRQTRDQLNAFILQRKKVAELQANQKRLRERARY